LENIQKAHLENLVGDRQKMLGLNLRKTHCDSDDDDDVDEDDVL
jgi:hypothetical protein